VNSCDKHSQSLLSRRNALATEFRRRDASLVDPLVAVPEQTVSNRPAYNQEENQRGREVVRCVNVDNDADDADDAIRRLREGSTSSACSSEKDEGGFLDRTHDDLVFPFSLSTKVSSNTAPGYERGWRVWKESTFSLSLQTKFGQRTDTVTLE
jgi:hypothetical protein